MNFSIASILALLAAVSVQSRRPQPRCDSSSSSSTTDCSFSSSSSSSDCGDIRRLCKRYLEHVEAQPNLPAVCYFRNLQAQIEAQSPLWLNPSTVANALTNFANSNQVTVQLIDAFGSVQYYNGVEPAKGYFTTEARTQALNKGVYVAGNSTESYYTFQMFSPTGVYWLVKLIAPKSQLPLNNLAYKRNCLFD